MYMCIYIYLYVYIYLINVAYVSLHTVMEIIANLVYFKVCSFPVL